MRSAENLSTLRLSNYINMKFQYWSDIHNEFWKGKWKDAITEHNDCPLLLAGDFGEFCRNKTVDDFKYLCERYPKVYYVNGNHDFYQSSFPIIDAKMDQLEKEISNLVVMRTGRIEQLGAYKLIGDTMWIKDRPDLRIYKIYDYSQIKDCLPEATNRFERWREWAATVMDENTIVMTHHVPSYQLVNPRFSKGEHTHWFIGDCEDLILKHKPKLWVAGHTHDCFDRIIGETRVVINPWGYPNEGTNPTRGPITIEL